MTFSIKDLVIFKVVDKNKILSLNQILAQFSFLECVLEPADCPVIGEHADSRSDHKSVFVAVFDLMTFFATSKTS